MPEEVKKNAAEQAAQAQKQPVPMPTTYEALRHDLIASGRAYDFDMIDRAYQLASAAHATQFRRSGEPYICHPISVAQLLVELGMDSESVAAALMHDVAEDTPVTIDEIRSGRPASPGGLAAGGKPAQNAACHEPGCPRDDHKAV